MLLVIFGIILVVCIVLFFLTMNTRFESVAMVCFFVAVVTAFLGFGMVGTMMPVETEIIIPQGYFIEKNENSIVLVVPNIGNKVITDPAIVAYIEVGDTVKVRKEYNSYGLQVDRTRIYVEKNGWKY